jgi:very-short-patch-repair endonuclease
VDVVGKDGGILETAGLRGAWATSEARGYLRTRPQIPRRNAARPKDISGNDDEFRAFSEAELGAEGSVLERIVLKRLSIIWGVMGVDFKWQDPEGDRSIDIAVYNRPSGKNLALEVQGYVWHGPFAYYADTDRALFLMARGWDYAEIWEHEIMLGDEYLDQRLMELIGAPRRFTPLREYEREEIRRFDREVGIRGS